MPPKKKMNLRPLAFVVVLALSISVTLTTQAVKKGRITKLIEKAGSIYQPSSTDVLEIADEDVEIGGALYNEIANYDAATAATFTENGLKELEESTILGTPIIVRQDGKVYRASCVDDALATDFFSDITSVKIILKEEKFSIYRVNSVPKLNGQSLEPVVIDVTVSDANNKLLIDDFNFPLSDNNQ